MSSISRRVFLVGIVLLAACILSATSRGLAAEPAPRPNFIFLITDDQRWDALGVVQKEMGDKARFPWIRTPNMDRIANEGVRFRNAFVVNSLCAPSRACFLSGQYSHLNGVANNHTAFPAENITWASQLRKSGYVTGYFGKWHQGKQEERPGFDEYASFIGQGKYEDCAINVNGQITPSKGWVDDVTTNYAMEFIRRHRGKPFAMTLGFKSPHDPRTPPARSKNLYPEETPRPVPNMNLTAVFRQSGGGGAGPENIRNYFRCISAVDDNIGKILSLLDDLKLAEDTVIVFWGDNGYYFGEHGLGDKRSAYDESLRIPMLLRYPRMGVKGKTIDDLVLNIDLAPTALDLAGAPTAPSMQGRSWKPLLEGKTVGWRKAFFYEYFLENAFANTPTVLAVRTDDAKLIKYPGHDSWMELYDLKTDPYETRNLVADPGHAELLKHLQAVFDEEQKAVQFRVPPYADTPGEGKSGKAGKNGKAKGGE